MITIVMKYPIRCDPLAFFSKFSFHFPGFQSLLLEKYACLQELNFQESCLRKWLNVYFPLGMRNPLLLK